MASKGEQKGQFYSSKYSDEFSFITVSKKGKQHAFCKVCRRDLSVAHGGRSDIVTHSKSKLHLTNVKDEAQTTKLTSFMSSPQDINTTRAECLFTAFYLEHNIPFSAASHVGPLLRKAFPKSDEVKKFSSARTKTTCLVHEMARDAQNKMISAMKTGPFAISTDGSHTSDSKLYPIVINFYDDVEKQIVCSLFSIPNLQTQSTGENIAKLLTSEMKKHDIPWKNCTALGSDNAAVMVGIRKGVGSYLKECQPNIIVLGCPNHLIDLAAKAASSALPFSVDSLLVDVFYYLEASVNRKLKLREFQKLCGNEVQKILKHVCTRWLSLGQCLPRFLDHWRALSLFFDEEVAQQKKVAKATVKISPRLEAFQIPKVASSPRLANKTPCSSVGSKVPAGSSKVDASESNGKKRPNIDNTPKVGAMPTKKVRTEKTSEKTTKRVSTITTTSKTSTPTSKKTTHASTAASSTQSKGNYKMDSESEDTRQERIVKALKSKFKLAFAHFLSQSITAFDRKSVILRTRSPLIHKLKRELEGLLQDIYSKFVTPDAIKAVSNLTDLDYRNPKNQKEDSEIVIGSETREIIATELKESECEKFFTIIRLYYTKACDYIVAKFPLKSDILLHAEVADLGLRVAAKFSSVRFFINKFPCMVLVKESETMHGAIDALQEQFLAYQLNDIPPVVLEETDVDKQWALMAEAMGPSGQLCYDRLAKVMLGILTIPHSNAECERVFSQVRKNKTDFRGSMSNDLLSALLVTKAQQKGPCYAREFDTKFLRRAKSATYAALNDDSSRDL